MNDIEKTIEYLRQQKGFTRDLPTTEMNRHLDLSYGDYMTMIGY